MAPGGPEEADEGQEYTRNKVRTGCTLAGDPRMALSCWVLSAFKISLLIEGEALFDRHRTFYPFISKRRKYKILPSPPYGGLITTLRDNLQLVRRSSQDDDNGDSAILHPSKRALILRSNSLYSIHPQTRDTVSGSNNRRSA
ncbi:hypothetical protein TEQG_02069 [Trichophyton equinum CBS 127.97]|uniref:Uncharacterized protein n=1 Tax=Trichophyton equinum (strain ATCC MYA-4606 / CBS 127.97) TaxID=559882 RepID=F2PMD5_TRIEC|nr:hypothetical protein TEQG_02069 [Trichophyton equinum CBS 127.97]